MTNIEEKTYYELLGVASGASADEIKTAYREIARIYHPDSNFFDEIIETPLDNNSMDIFKRITAAYNVLVNPEKRAEYDKTLLQGIKRWDDEDESEMDASYRRRSTQNPYANPGPSVSPRMQAKKTGFGKMATPSHMCAQEDDRVKDISSVSDIMRKRAQVDRTYMAAALGIFIGVMIVAVLFVLKMYNAGMLGVKF